MSASEVYPGLWCVAANYRYRFGFALFIGSKCRWRAGAREPGVTGLGVGGLFELFVGPQGGLG